VIEVRTIAAVLGELNVTATTLARQLRRSGTDLAHTVRLLDPPRRSDRTDGAWRPLERPR
jgi:hypothetical protein